MKHSELPTGRQSNIELLKIILVIGVIILHYGSNENIQLDSAGLNGYILNGLKSIFTCAVDTFILISGYFMAEKQRVTVEKPIRLLLQVAIFGEIGYQMQCMINGVDFSLKHFLGHLIPINYYVTLYCCTYLLAPFLNILVKNLKEHELKHFLIIIIGILSIWPTFVDVLSSITGNDYNSWGLNSISIHGDGGGYTLINFILMYWIGACLKKLKSELYYDNGNYYITFLREIQVFA